MDYCIYCGHNELNSYSGEFVECCRCGLIIAHSELTAVNNALAAELRPHPDEAPNGCDAEEVYASEEETLNSAWQLMQNQAWEKALDALAPAAIPSQHPLEFAVWRDICRLAPALTDKDLKRRFPLLDILSHNLLSLDFFLSSSASEKRYRTLKRLYQALTLLRGVSLQYINDLTPGAGGSLAASYETNSECASILTALAEAMESQGAATVYGTECLKISAQLYHWSLELYLAPLHKDAGFLHAKYAFKLSAKTRSHISAVIAQLNEKIAQRDGEFIPQEKIPEPKFTSDWMSCLIFIAIAFILLIVFIALFFRYLSVPSLIKKYEEQLIICFIAFQFFTYGIIWIDANKNERINASYDLYYKRLAQELKTAEQNAAGANRSL